MPCNSLPVVCIHSTRPKYNIMLSQLVSHRGWRNVVLHSTYFQLLEFPIQGPDLSCRLDNLQEQRNEFLCITLHDPCNYHTSFCICSFSAIRPAILSSRRDILAVSALSLIYQKSHLVITGSEKKKGGARSKK